MRLFVNDKPSSIDEICKMLSIRTTDIPFEHKNKTFDRLGFENKIDPQTKKPIKPRGHGVPCTMNVTLKSGESAKLTYAENSRPATKHGANILQHSPKNLMIEGLSTSVRDDEKVKFFWLYLHFYNEQSPLNLGKTNPPVVYKFKNTKTDAQKENRKEDEILDALIILKELGNPEVRQLAKGYNITNGASIDDYSDEEVRSLMRKKIVAAPSQFIIDMNDNEIALKGIIQDSIDKKIITSQANGLSKNWMIGDRVICSTVNGVDEMMSLQATIESDLEVFMPILLQKIQKIQTESRLKQPEAKKWFGNFNGATSNPDEVNSLDELDRRAAGNQWSEEDRIAQHRKWYAFKDVNTEGLNANTKRAMIKHKEVILAQFRKDVADGVVPADTPEPILDLKETE